MEPIEAALESLKLQDVINLSATARQFNVDRSTLSRRWNKVTNPASMQHLKQQLLTPEQERELVKYINKLTERGILPTPSMVRNFAKDIGGVLPGRTWLSRFCLRHQDSIICRYLKNIDIQRSKADSAASYKLFYDLLKEKLAKYHVLPQDTYNMDEKGFMIGVMNTTRRIFSKQAFDKGQVLGSNQDGNREWITVLATVCADGSFLPPAVLYKSQSGDIQASWVAATASIDHQAHVAPSETGWTNDNIAIHWLEEKFNRYTKPKASNGLRYRLLYVDGHGSHLNMNFITWCDNNRILLAIYPPHSTHRLQPLDVSLFSPLVVHYGTKLNQLMLKSQDLLKITKKDFLKLFWPAFTKAFSQSNVLSAWQKTGLYPLDSNPVISQLSDNSNRNKDELNRPQSNTSSGSSAISSSEVRQIRTLLEVIATSLQETNHAKKLKNTVFALATQNQLLKAEVSGLKQTAFEEKKQNKRTKGLFEEL